jgi:hypothetical protein
VENNSGGCTKYYYTFGHGPVPSNDLARWGYYPGAYARCALSVTIPASNGRAFNPRAHYKVVTGAGHTTVVADLYLNQATWAGAGPVSLGMWSADGSGYLAVWLDDSSPSGGTVRVVATTVRFGNCHNLA